MQARYPDLEGDVVRDGVRTHYYVYGEGKQTLLLLPTWVLAHARLWKAQVPYLSRYFRVVTFDGRGNGKSDRPTGIESYRAAQYVADAFAVLDAVGVRSAVLAGASMGGHYACLMAAERPEQVAGLFLIAPSVPFGQTLTSRSPEHFLEPRPSTDGWDKFNRHYWKEHYPDFVRWYTGRIFTEDHSTKQRDDVFEWAQETDPEVLAETVVARFDDGKGAEEAYRSIRCPAVIVHGDEDACIPLERGVTAADVLNAPLVKITNGGHLPICREPVLVNRMIKDFMDGLAGNHLRVPTVYKRGPRREKRALYLSSPIGLGHARRDLAVAQALRERKPDLKIDWLTQHPVTAFLESEGEGVHEASGHLVSESAHVESECGEHDLHVFQTLRNMDEILVANFMVFQEVVESRHYDLVIADEAWDVDHFWHEHPELKRAPLAWFTDFVGFVPFEDGGERESFLTTDYNAEMIEHWERYPWMRDRALFVGSPEDVVPGTFGAGLPEIRAWTERHFAFPGYISGYDPGQWGEPAELRAALGYHPDERVCVVSVGGSGVGTPLLRRILEAWPTVHRKLPELRMVMVTGPRIDPASLPVPKGKANGIDVRGYVPELNKHFTACDLALVQGGLTTCMELTAARRPFLYFPLAHHFEQCFHVHHRLQRHNAGRRMDYATADPDAIAEAMVAELARTPDYRPVETDGAGKAAALLAEML